MYDIYIKTKAIGGAIVRVFIAIVIFFVLMSSSAFAQAGFKAHDWKPVVEKLSQKIILLKKTRTKHVCVVTKRSDGAYNLTVAGRGVELTIYTETPWYLPYSDKVMTRMEKLFGFYRLTQTDRTNMYVMSICGAPIQSMVEFLPTPSKKKVAKK